MLITDPQQIDAAWLDAVLRRAGTLRNGGVVAIEVDASTKHAWSRIVPISVRYAEGSTGELHERLLLKLCSAEGGVFGPSELHYYTRDYVGLAGAPLARCFDAAYEDSPRRYHLLLEDLSATHTNANSLTPDEGYAHALADALAALHAHCWGADRLREIDLEMPGRADFERYIGHVGQGLEPMLTLIGHEIGPAWVARLRSLVAQLAHRFAQRARDLRGITQIHGDLNPGNILAPRGGSGRIVLIDRQPFDWSLTHWLGVSDLAYAMVLWWCTDLRRRFEMPALKRYHAALHQKGITDYAWNQLLDDYRLCVVEALMVAVEWGVLESDRERMRWLWTQEMRKAMAAFEDLGCEALWT
jgi:thiamine kinase-like enzyme